MSSTEHAQLWSTIERLETVRTELFAAQRQANADTRWWLLVPMGALLVLMALVVGGGVYVPLSSDDFYGVLVAGVVLTVVLVAVEAWLVRKLVASRGAGRPHRRELEDEEKQLAQRLSDLESEDAGALPPREATSQEELTEELEEVRRSLVDESIRIRTGWSPRYLLCYALPLVTLAVPFSLIVIVGVVFPLSTADHYWMLGVAVVLMAPIVWAWRRLFRSAREPEIVSKPRRRVLRRQVKHLEAELTRRYGKEAVRRQPTAYAQMMWRRYPSLGPSPAVALRRQPENAGTPALWFHRHVGWGVCVAIGIAVAVLLVGSLT